jgi:hypothetical protein
MVEYGQKKLWWAKMFEGFEMRYCCFAVQLSAMVSKTRGIAIGTYS